MVGASGSDRSLRNDSVTGAYSELVSLAGNELQSWRRRIEYLWEVDAKSIHVEPVEKAGEGLAEAGQALVHELEVHHIGFQVCHCV